MVRAARVVDEPAMVALWRRCGLLRTWIDPAAELALKRRHQPEGTWVAVRDEVVVGTVLAGFDGRRGWLHYLAVAPDARGLGLGRHLVHVAERDLAARGCPKVNLQVRADNLVAVGFYEALGYADDAVVSLGKRLPGPSVSGRPASTGRVAPTPRPVLVLVTGAPGSGKTSLGSALADVLRVPFLARDAVRGGLFGTAGSWGADPGPVPAADEAVEAFLEVLEAMAARGVSAVAEYVVRRSRPGDLRRLTDAFEVVVVQVDAADARDRWVERNGADRLLARRPVLDALGFDSVEQHTAAAHDRLDAVVADMEVAFEVPVVRFDDVEGDAPSLDALVDRIRASVGRWS